MPILMPILMKYKVLASACWLPVRASRLAAGGQLGTRGAGRGQPADATFRLYHKTRSAMICVVAFTGYDIIAEIRVGLHTLNGARP